MLQGFSESDLIKLQRPAQYLGGELNSIVKNDADIDVHFALAFPDTYEVGMSHIGMQILYDLLNRDPAVWAERAFTPMADMENVLREKNVGLFSLESKRPLSSFDVIGFSLQYELCGTNILSMLDLSRIPLLAADRADSAPFVIGGGPYSYHPEALAPFFDAFFIGDAEEAMSELVDAVRKVKSSGVFSRRKLIDAVKGIEGIYVPSLYEAKYDEGGRFLGTIPLQTDVKPEIVRRLLPSMVNAPFPTKPIVPTVETVHNRLSLEVMRGCVRGCRFCQAGYLYRPQRERSPEEIRKLVGDILPQTGYEELSLLSLSTADYCSIVPLLKSLMDKYADEDKLSISFPSTRVDALRPEVLEQVQRVRRTNFTIAPEGGSQRLRNVINKGVTDEEIIETCSNVFTMGWNGIKLYFMLGLPTETDEDLYGIIDLAKRVRALPCAKNKDITVSVSTHVPKPHTPFQWAEQISVEETKRKQALLAGELRAARVNFRCHDAFSSFLEGVFCRSGRELAPAILRAFELGCRLDAWQDHLNQQIWMQAFADCGIDPHSYLRERSIEEALPWDHISCGIPKSYFTKEWKRALKFKETPDCLTQSCSICSACNYDDKRNVLFPRNEFEELMARESVAKAADPPTEASAPGRFLYRIKYRKFGPMKFVGHLELVTVFHRAARRAEIPLAFSEGFHPMPRISFGPPIPLGMASEAEYMDMELTSLLDMADLIKRFNGNLPEGLEISEARTLSMSESSIQASIYKNTFRVKFDPAAASAEDLRNKLDDAILGNLTVSREPKRKPRRQPYLRNQQQNQNPQPPPTTEFKLSEHVSNLRNVSSNEMPELEFELRVHPTGGSLKPAEVITALTSLATEAYSVTKIGSEFKI
jgi:radical SAM family uncharacterized protein/radical SAM-linked protein